MAKRLGRAVKLKKVGARRVARMAQPRLKFAGRKAKSSADITLAFADPDAIEALQRLAKLYNP